MIILSSAFMLPSAVQAAAPPKTMSPATRQAIAQDVIGRKQKAIAARDALVALPQEERAAALMASGGALNVLLQGRFAHVKNKPWNSKVEAFKAADLALIQLSDLALRLGFKAAAVCHIQESYQMRLLAQGEHAEIVGCRPTAYPSSIEMEAMNALSSPRAAKLDQLTRNWAKQTFFSCSAAAVYDAKIN